MDLDKEEEIRQYQNFISDIKSQISTPFIQRRLEQQKVKEDQQEEIQELIEEINQKEEQLNDLSDLGNFLIENVQNTELKFLKQIEQLEETENDLKIEIEFQKQSVNEYRKMYNEILQKMDDMQQQVIDMEKKSDQEKFNYLEKESMIKERTQSIQEQNLQAKESNQQLVAENFKLKDQVKELSEHNQKMKVNLKEVETQNRKFRENIEKQNNEIFEAQNKVKQIQRKLEEKEQNLLEVQKQLYEQSLKNDSQEQLIKELKQQYREIQMSYSNQQQDIMKASSNHLNTNNLSNQHQKGEENQEAKLEKEQQGVNLFTEIQEIAQKNSFMDDEGNNFNLNLNINVNNLSDEQQQNDILKQNQNDEDEPAIEVIEDKEGNNQEQKQIQNSKQNSELKNSDSENKQIEILLGDYPNLNNSQEISKRPENEHHLLKTPKQKQSFQTSNIIEQAYLDMKNKPKGQVHEKSKQLHNLLQRKKYNFNSQIVFNEDDEINQDNLLVQNAGQNKSGQETDKNAENNQKNKQMIAKRREPYEEFFNLTGQCVKLNSKFMDDILALDISGYYQHVREKGIPYHKWYKYIEKKLQIQRYVMMINDNTLDDLSEYHKLKEEVDNFGNYY